MTKATKKKGIVARIGHYIKTKFEGFLGWMKENRAVQAIVSIRNSITNQVRKAPRLAFGLTCAVFGTITIVTASPAVGVISLVSIVAGVIAFSSDDLWGGMLKFLEGYFGMLGYFYVAAMVGLFLVPTVGVTVAEYLVLCFIGMLLFWTHKAFLNDRYRYETANYANRTDPQINLGGMSDVRRAAKDLGNMVPAV